MTSLSQTSSPRRPEYSGPSIEATRRAFAADITRDAIDRYEDALHRYVSALARAGDDKDLDRFVHVAAGGFDESARNLANAILAWRSDDSFATRPCKQLQRPRGVVHGGKLYLAVADEVDRLNMIVEPERFEWSRDEDGLNKMHVVVIDLAEIVELATLLPESGRGGAE